MNRKSKRRNESVYVWIYVTCDRNLWEEWEKRGKRKRAILWHVLRFRRSIDQAETELEKLNVRDRVSRIRRFHPVYVFPKLRKRENNFPCDDRIASFEDSLITFLRISPFFGLLLWWDWWREREREREREWEREWEWKFVYTPSALCTNIAIVVVQRSFCLLSSFNKVNSSWPLQFVVVNVIGNIPFGSPSSSMFFHVFTFFVRHCSKRGRLSV